MLNHKILVGRLDHFSILRFFIFPAAMSYIYRINFKRVQRFSKLDKILVNYRDVITLEKLIKLGREGIHNGTKTFICKNKCLQSPFFPSRRVSALDD